MGEFNRFVKANQLKFFFLVKLTILKHFDFAPLCLLLQGESRGSSAIARSVAAAEDQSLLESIALRGSRTPRSWEDDAIQIPVTQESTHAKNGTFSPLGVCQIRLANSET